MEEAEPLEIQTVPGIEASSAEGLGVDFQEEGGDVSRLPVLSFSVSSLSPKAGHQDSRDWSRAVAFEARLLPSCG